MGSLVQPFQQPEHFIPVPNIFVLCSAYQAFLLLLKECFH